MSQMEPEGTRRSQKEPGGAREIDKRSQEDPGTRLGTPWQPLGLYFFVNLDILIDNHDAIWLQALHYSAPFLCNLARLACCAIASASLHRYNSSYRQ
jgi:hypothetical protein